MSVSSGDRNERCDGDDPVEPNPCMVRRMTSKNVGIDETREVVGIFNSGIWCSVVSVVCDEKCTVDGRGASEMSSSSGGDVSTAAPSKLPRERRWWLMDEDVSVDGRDSLSVSSRHRCIPSNSAYPNTTKGIKKCSKETKISVTRSKGRRSGRRRGEDRVDVDVDAATRRIRVQRRRGRQDVVHSLQGLTRIPVVK